MTKNQRISSIVGGALLLLSIGGFVYVKNIPQEESVGIIPDVAEEAPVIPIETAPNPPLVIETPPVKPQGPTKGQEYYQYTLKSADVAAELTDLVGEGNVAAILQTNRMDINHIKKGANIVIPVAYDMASRSPFPLAVEDFSSVKKLLVISQEMQAFGVYESGSLVRWGPVSSGKQSTPTPSRLFSTNWKGREVKSTFDDEWILKYNFNLDNFEGIGFHQYDMPGYPASHSCVRLLEEDAVWLYNWADQWIISSDEQTRLAHGTPVIIFGDYHFGKTAPWKLLPSDADATDITEADMEALAREYLPSILAREAQREAIISEKAGLTAQ